VVKPGIRRAFYLNSEAFSGEVEPVRRRKHDKSKT
jgi:hypothetical protein